MVFIGFPQAILTMVTLGPGVGPQGPTGELSEGPGAWALAANLYSARCGGRRSSDRDQPRPANHPGTMGIYSTLGIFGHKTL